MSETTTREKVFRLAEERPDLIHHLARALQLDDGPMEDIPQEALDEFTRRGLLKRDER
jgi:hypothetical protein